MPLPRLSGGSTGGAAAWLGPLAVAAFAMAVGGCAGSGASQDAGTDATSAPPDTTAPEPAGDAGPVPVPPEGQTLYGVRYCEILTVTPASDGTVSAEVWNTMGLGDCPQEAWDAVDLDDARDQTGAALAVRNGPRYWVLDRIVPGSMAGSLEVRDFGGVPMRSIARVELPSMNAGAAYTETSVRRDTVFTFAAGREIYELTAPDGSVYVMQSYSQQVDPAQTAEDLASLADRLTPPPGWRFTARVLTEDLDVTTLDGLATVVTDDLRNTYQLRSRPG